MVLLDALGRRWTLRILWELNGGRLSFRALRSRCDDISPSVLNSRLKLLRSLGFVDLNASGYGLTPVGADLGGKFAELDQWATDWAEKRRDRTEP